MTTPLISVRLLDGFELLVDDQGVAVTPSSQRLLAYLALHDRPVTRTALAARLWPDVAERRASACLRSALWRMVKCAGTPTSSPGPSPSRACSLPPRRCP